VRPVHAAQLRPTGACARIDSRVYSAMVIDEPLSTRPSKSIPRWGSAYAVLCRCRQPLGDDHVVGDAWASVGVGGEPVVPLTPGPAAATASTEASCASQATWWW